MVARRFTVEDLDAMTPEQRREVFEASIVRDLAELPADRLTELRVRAAGFAADRDAVRGTVRGAGFRQIACGG